MTPTENPKSQISEPREPLPLSLLNDYLYCSRRAGLKLIEGWRDANEHTVRGDIVHEHADFAGYESQISNLGSQIVLLRALPVYSERLGLNGKCDIVEVHGLPEGEDSKSQISNLKLADGVSIRPIEFKLGKRRQWSNDDAQLCAQALCLEEMFGVDIPKGAIFHANSKRRREVEFTPELRQLTLDAVNQLHALLEDSQISNLKSQFPALPPAVFKPACEECSLFETCLPKLTEAPDAVERARRQLFET